MAEESSSEATPTPGTSTEATPTPGTGSSTDTSGVTTRVLVVPPKSSNGSGGMDFADFFSQKNVANSDTDGDQAVSKLLNQETCTKVKRKRQKRRKDPEKMSAMENKVSAGRRS